MKILFVIKSLSLPGGGAERVLLNIAGAMAGRQEVSIATFDTAGSSSFYPAPPDVDILPLGSGDVRQGTGPHSLLSRIGLLRRLLMHLKPSVAVGFMHSSYVPLTMAAIGSGIPVVASEHTVFRHYRGRMMERAALRATAPAVTLYTAVSERVRAGFPDAIRRKMVVIPNPVIATDRKSGGSLEAPRILLSVGRLDAYKDHTILLEAFGRVAARHPEWILRIVGEGELRPTLERQAADLGLRGRVQLPGPSAQIGKEYASADLFAMPSRYESFGLATAEALAAGVPAIGFADCPGTNELIRNGLNGLLVEGADRAGALAEGLDILMASAAHRRRMAKAAPASVIQYSLASVVSRWEAMLEKAANER